MQDTSDATARNFFRNFERLSREMPNRAAVVHYSSRRKFTEISYGALAEQSDLRGAALSNTYAAGSMVFIIEHDPLEQIYWWLAARRHGFVPGILTPPTPKIPGQKYYNDLSAILAAHPEAVVVYGKGIFEVAPAEARISSAEAIMAGRPPASAAGAADGGPAPWPDSVTDNPPYLFQQSSGTTGLRKGVLLSEKAVINQLKAYGTAINIRKSDVIVSWLPLYHDMGFVACFLGSLFWGLPLVITSPFVWLHYPAWLFQAVVAHGGTLCWLPNFAFSYLADRVDPGGFGATDLRQFRLAVNCSEPILARSMAKFRETFAAIGLRPQALSSSYAMAEYTFAVTQARPGGEVRVETVSTERLETANVAVPAEVGRTFVASGVAIPGAEIRIAAADGELLGEGQVGEIQVRGDCLMSGYYGIGGETQPIDREGWLSTGDLGYLRGDDLFVIGRGKDIIVRAGRNIDPTILEAAAGSVEDVKPGRTVAFGVMNQALGTEEIVILAESVLAGNKEETNRISRDIALACNIEVGIAPHVVAVVPPESLLKSSSGKISRELCRQQFRKDKQNR